MSRRRSRRDEPPEGAPAGTRYLLWKLLSLGDDGFWIDNDRDHEYQITRGGVAVANISKRWFRVRDSYGVTVVAGQDDALVLAVTVCIDHLTSHGR